MTPYIYINSVKQWLKGYYQGVLIDEWGLSIHDGYGCYIGELIDSNEYEHKWSRIRIEKELRGESKVIVYTSVVDQPIVTKDGKNYDLVDIVKNKSMSPIELLDILKKLPHKKYENQNDILINNQNGKYLIYWIEIISEGISDVINGIRVYYNYETWLDYLPQIYSEEKDFLERYLYIFQTFFDDLEEIVTSMPSVYNPLRTRRDFLDTLNNWLPMDSFEFFTESQKRILLMNYHVLNKIRGTKEGLIKLITLFTGYEPFIVEYKDYKYLNSNASIYNRLYFDSPFGFTILLPSNVISDKSQFNALGEIIKNYIPAQVSFKISPLNPYIVLDDYAYLGINSYIHNQTDIKLDERTMLSMGVIGYE